jgi:DNA-binding transcriptional LysR family regulator
LHVGLYATPELLAEQGVPDSIVQLKDFPLIGPDRNLAEIELLQQQGFDCTSERTLIRTDDHLAQLAALRAGLGIGVCSGQLARRYGLMRVLPQLVGFDVDVWVAMHQDMRRVPRVAVAFEAVGAGLAEFLTA